MQRRKKETNKATVVGKRKSKGERKTKWREDRWEGQGVGDRAGEKTRSVTSSSDMVLFKLQIKVNFY